MKNDSKEKQHNYNHAFDVTISAHKLYWDEGAIPEDEICLKFGGDKGGGTFKMCFQLLNVPSPNASDNTCTFTMF